MEERVTGNDRLILELSADLANQQMFGMADARRSEHLHRLGLIYSIVTEYRSGV